MIKPRTTPAQEEPDLSALSLELEENSNIGQRIKISTAIPINSRLLTLPLKVQCLPHGPIIREFNLELKPAPNTLFQHPQNFSSQAEKMYVKLLQKPELNGSIRAGYFSSSRRLDGIKDLGTGSMWLKATQNIGDDITLLAKGWVRDDKSYGFSKKLQEGYLNFSVGNMDFRVGRQIIAWGRADRFNPTDNLTLHTINARGR